MQQTVAELPVLDRAWAWLTVNWKPALWVSGAVLAVALGVTFYFVHQRQVEYSASEALSRIEAQFALPGAARNESAEPYLKVANEHAGTVAAARALLQAGTILFDQGKYAEAQTQFQRFIRDYSESPLRGNAMLGNAACLDALAKPEEAAAAYRSVSEQRAGEPAATQAKFALARIYESQGKLDQARTLYEDVARADPQGTAGNEAGLKADELRAKAPPPAATNAAPPTATGPATPTITTSTPPVVKTTVLPAPSSGAVQTPPPAAKTNQP